MDLTGLGGCPYSLPHGSEALEAVEKLVGVESNVRRRLKELRSSLSEPVRREIARVQESREIYESNSIEGLGPDIERTDQILSSPLADDVGLRLSEALLADSVLRDADMRSVLGLHGAKSLARRLLLDIGLRPVTEADLRSLHEMIATGEYYAGRYKHYHVTISGSEHTPPVPLDAPAAMHELTMWLAGADDLPATLKAACAHTWLTHIHPFEDGNGRLARVLANFCLAKVGLPPAIVKNESERGAYIDALAHSDSGGDIMPLVGLFEKAIRRYAKQISRPSAVRRLFNAEIRSRYGGIFGLWDRQLGDFTSALEGELTLRRIRSFAVGAVGPEEFSYLRRREPAGNTWFRILASASGQVLLLWFGHPTVEMRRWVDRSDAYPSLFFSVRNNAYSALPYRLASPEEVEVREVMLLPGATPRVYARFGSTVKVGDFHDASETVAEAVALAFRRGRLPLAQSVSFASLQAMKPEQRAGSQ